MNWSHRDRLLAALNHEEADRVAIDFGGTPASGITVPAYETLKAHLGLDHDTVVADRIADLAALDESVSRRFDVDVRTLGFGAEPREIDHDTLFDEWGVTWHRAPDGSFMPVDGPFRRRAPDLSDLEDWAWPDPDDPKHTRELAAAAEALARSNDCAIVSCLPAMPVHVGQCQRGFAEWLKDLRRNPGYVCRLMDIVADVWIAIVVQALEAVGNKVDVVFVGDDLASQEGPLFSPALYRELVKPRHRRMIAAVKASCDAKILYYSCGAVFPMIEDLIDIGVDALNPLQVSARGMDPERLEETFGDRLAFWGGVDTQRILPYGSVDEVRAETRRIIYILGSGGGYVLNSVHDIQPEVPAANVAAMFDAGRMHSQRQAARRGMKLAAHDPTTLVICCGAVAREIVGLVRENGWNHIRVECLPAHRHNSAARIPEGVRAKIRANRDRYDEILVRYTDCGTHGALDKVLEEEGIERVSGGPSPRRGSNSPTSSKRRWSEIRSCTTFSSASILSGSAARPLRWWSTRRWR